MKIMKETALKAMAKSLEKAAYVGANTQSIIVAFEPKVPAALKKSLK